MIRILVADDSATVREYLTFLLDQDPALQVVGTAQDGLDAVKQAERLKPDVIVMDVHMPRMNGYEATRLIMERVPTPIVMVSVSSTLYEATTAFEAIKAGALTVVEKPAGQDHSAQAEGTRRFLETVKLMAEVKVIRRWPRRERSAPPSPLWAKADGTIRLIAVGGSTGAPQIIADILARLPRNLGAPILVVQHIAPGFTGGFAEWLTLGTRLAVKLAEPGEATQPGTVYLAPEGSQTGITKEGRIRLTREPAEDGFCPSASYLFQSVAEAYGRSAIGIILSGMGRDGATGLKRLREVGGVTIAQDEESCVIFGMPQEAIRQGAVEHVLSPEQIVEAIRSLVSYG